MLNTAASLQDKKETDNSTGINRYRQQVSQLKDQIRKLNMELMVLRKAEENSAFEETDNTIYLRNGSLIKKYLIADIILIKAESNYSILYFTDGTQHLTCKTLKHWARELCSHPTFLRTHQSYIINKSHILEINVAQSEIQLEHGLKAMMSRKMKKAVLERLKTTI